MSQDDGALIMEDARIIFRNFAGKEGKYNAEGDRNFCLLLDQDTADLMAKDDWNIKYLRSREGSDEPDQPHVQVSVGYRHKPPTIVLITSKGRTTLNEEELEILDWVDIQTVDLIIRPYKWAVGAKSGVKAYLKSFFLTVAEDYLMLKYADLQDLNQLPATAGRVMDDDYIDGEIVETRRAIGA